MTSEIKKLKAIPLWANEKQASLFGIIPLDNCTLINTYIINSYKVEWCLCLEKMIGFLPNEFSAGFLLLKRIMNTIVIGLLGSVVTDEL